MVISQPPGNNPSYYYRASTPQLLWMLPETPYVLYVQLQHQGNSWNGILIFFTRIRSTEGSSADCSLFILSLHALALHLAVKILLQIFLYEDLLALALHTSVGCISSRMPAGPHFVAQPILLSENIPNIWHKSSTKHKEVRPDWNDKNDNANYAPSYHAESFSSSGCHFKRIFDQVRKDLDCELFYSELKRHNVSHYIYYLATDNIHIVLENDNTVLIKGLKKVVNVKFSKHASYRNVLW